MNEYEYEPVPGLPEELPPGESIVWQGTPDWRALAIRAFHVRKVFCYFALLLAWFLVAQWGEGISNAGMMTGALWTLLLGAAALVILGLLAWANARSTVYTLTSERLVLRFGVALPMMINLPLEKLEAANLVTYGNAGIGDIALTLEEGQRISYAAIWPHARPWHISRVQPMLRSLPDAATVATLLAQQVAAAAGNSNNVNIAIATADRSDSANAHDHIGDFNDAALSG